MAVSGVVSTKALTFNVTKTQKVEISCGKTRLVCVRRLKPNRPKIVCRVLDNGFCDKAHEDYYKVEKKGLKKKLKNVSSQLEGNTINEAKELLLKQFQQLKVEEKELKKRRKQEKAKLKAAAKMKHEMGCESSSESSSSSESECGEVIDMKNKRNKVSVKPFETETQLVTQDLQPPSHVEDARPMLNELLTMTREPSSLPTSSLPIQAEIIGSHQKKIEVCMGGKCKKSGAGALLEELGRAVGARGAVVGCKCMGKCKEGPNVRVLNDESGVQCKAVDDSVKTLVNPLYLGVGLDDVGGIMSSFFGEDGNDMLPSLAA